MEISKKEAEQRIIKLREVLNEHNYEYYVLSKPTISDFEYDKLMKELIDLEERFPEFSDDNSPSRRVGDDRNIAFKQVQHYYPMLSLGNTYSKAELADFDKRVKKGIGEDFEYVCELKYDGTAISITYQEGKLLRAVTRGDGTTGDEITANVRTIKTIPLQLQNKDFPSFFEVRGEIFMPFEGFKRFNEQRIQKGEEPFANPRNATSGSLKIQNPSLVARRPLDCYIYSILGEDLPHASHYENLTEAKKWGLKVPEHIRKCHTLNEVYDFIDYWEKERDKLPYGIDGVVIKVNAYEKQKQLGYTSNSPRWAISYKFKAEQALTTINSIDYQVGRTGAITPVANLEPVQLAGTIVKRASLHNADQIALLDVRIHDKVYVEKGGEIIPKIVGVDKSQRPPDSEKIEFIQFCPECGTELIRKEGEARHFCPNEYGCPPQIKGKIEHFVSRKAMDIGLAQATINQLYENNLIRDYADLYQLNKKDLLNLERFGEKSASNLINSIENSKKNPYHRLLYALGIKHIGETAAKTLAKYFKSIDALRAASYEDLIDINEIGDKIAQSIIDFFYDDKNIEIIEKLKNAGVNLSGEERDSREREAEVAANQRIGEVNRNQLSGKTIVISGKFEQFSRDELKEIIESSGGKNASSISSKTDFIVAGENMGPSKRKKAEELDIPVISENEFLKMIQ